MAKPAETWPEPPFLAHSKTACLTDDFFRELDAVNSLVDRHLFSTSICKQRLLDETGVGLYLHLAQVRRVNMC